MGILTLERRNTSSSAQPTPVLLLAVYPHRSDMQRDALRPCAGDEARGSGKSAASLVALLAAGAASVTLRW